MNDQPEQWYAEGGYIGPTGPGLGLIHRSDYFISAEQLARLGLDYMKRTYGKPDEEEDVD